jgi:hypothetical protein
MASNMEGYKGPRKLRKTMRDTSVNFCSELDQLSSLLFRFSLACQLCIYHPSATPWLRLLQPLALSSIDAVIPSLF